jgi:hypothetical protein
MSTDTQLQEYIKTYNLYIQIFKTSILSYNLINDKNLFLGNLAELSSKFMEFKKVSLKKIVKSLNNVFPLSFIYKIEELPVIENKDILVNQEFLNIFHNILESIIYINAFNIANIGDFIDMLINYFNKITLPEYIILDCDKLSKETKSKVIEEISMYSYNCGRSVMQISKKNSRFLIFNTNDDGQMDVNIIKKYSKLEEKFFQETLAMKNGVITGNIEAFVKILKDRMLDTRCLSETALINKLKNLSKKTDFLSIKIPILPEYILKIETRDFTIILINDQESTCDNIEVIRNGETIVTKFSELFGKK